MNQPTGKKTGVNAILITFLAMGVILSLGYKGFGWENNFNKEELTRFFNFPTAVEIEQPKAWQVLESYLEALRTHDLAKTRELSHQTSAACSDPDRRAECFSLMDNVYEIGRTFSQSDFRHMEEDERQLIMYTDGPLVTILFFTKNQNDALKILGIRFCLEDERRLESCVEKDSVRQDLDNNGWWDSVESLFNN